MLIIAIRTKMKALRKAGCLGCAGDCGVAFFFFFGLSFSLPSGPSYTTFGVLSDSILRVDGGGSVSSGEGDGAGCFFFFLS